MSKKRPGYEAALRLSTSTDVSLWAKVEAQYSNPDVVDSDRQSLEAQADKIGKCQKLTKSQLIELIKWKFSVGKPRHALWKYLKANSTADVLNHTEKGIKLAMSAEYDETNIKEAINEVAKLQGVGPASASALLSRTRSDVFCYMYDEVLDVFRAKREYTVAAYLHVNACCHKIGGIIGWTTARVARALWIAARVKASGAVRDETAPETNLSTEKSIAGSSSSARPRKRIREHK